MSDKAVIEPSEIEGLTRKVRFLDVRSVDAFDEEHPPGAIRVPIEHWIAASATTDTGFGNVAYWEKEISALGIDNDTLALVYDDGRLTDAARVWFIIQYFGGRASLVNGGWPGIEGTAVEAGVATPASVGPFHARPGSGKVGLVDRHQLAAEVGRGTAVFDARTAAEYEGTDVRKNPRGGHIPGARNLAHASLIEDGWLKSPEVLHDMIAKAGFQPGDHIVTHCDGGGRAALAAMAAQRAGFQDVRVYYLSFADWAKDESCPVVTRD